MTPAGQREWIGEGGVARHDHHPAGTTRRRRRHRFCAREALGVGGVDQDHVQVVLQQVERGAPVIAGGLHHDQADPFGDQPVPQLQQRVGGVAKVRIS